MLHGRCGKSQRRHSRSDRLDCGWQGIVAGRGVHVGLSEWTVVSLTPQGCGYFTAAVSFLRPRRFMTPEVESLRSKTTTLSSPAFVPGTL